jgi:hypothetical protein
MLLQLVVVVAILTTGTKVVKAAVLLAATSTSMVVVVQWDTVQIMKHTVVQVSGEAVDAVITHINVETTKANL